MDDKIITTSGGYKVTLKPFLTYDQFIELQKMYTVDTKIDPQAKDPKISEFAANIVYEANKKAVGFLVVSIEDKDGKVVEREDNALPLPIADGQEVIDAINAMQNEAATSFDKKKVKTT